METLTQKQIKTVDPLKAGEYFHDKLTFTAGPMEVSHWIKEGASIRVIDVRAAEDYKKGHVPGAVSLPKDRWDSFEGLQKDKNNVLYCYSQTCHLAASAALKFANKGYPVMEMEGGFKTWQENNLETEKL
jgi:rhodanese-related sulfurtransferase